MYNAFEAWWDLKPYHCKFIAESIGESTLKNCMVNISQSYRLRYSVLFFDTQGIASDSLFTTTSHQAVSVRVLDIQ